MSKTSDAAKEACIDALEYKYMEYEDDLEFARAAAAELIYCDKFWEWADEFDW